MYAFGWPRSVSQSTVLVVVESWTIRAHERSTESPAGMQPVFALSQSFPSSQTASRIRSSFVSTVGWRPTLLSGGCCAGGGCNSGAIASDATGRTVTVPGGTPSTVSRRTTRELGLSTDTTYSVDVDESECTGVRLSNARSGP